MKITIPELSLVVLIGPSGCGKTTFAKQHFKPTEVLSSDFCRALVSDDENDQSATNDAFAVLHYIARKRLAAGRLTVVDATNVQPESRKPLVELAREFHVLPVAIIFDLPEKECHERNQTRSDRQFGPHVVRNQSAQLRRSLRGLDREGFRHIFKLTTSEEVAAVSVTRQPLWNNLKHEHGPFDIIGDVHGCFDELMQLLAELGYQKNDAGAFQPPDGRKAIFVGDLVDRGPKIPETVRLAKDMVDAGYAFCVPGNHDIKFMRATRGKNVQITHGLDESLRQFGEYDKGNHGFSRIAADFINKLISHYVLDDGKLVVAHAGMKEEMQGRGSGKVRDFGVAGRVNDTLRCQLGAPIAQRNLDSRYAASLHQRIDRGCVKECSRTGVAKKTIGRDLHELGMKAERFFRIVPCCEPPHGFEFGYKIAGVTADHHPGCVFTRAHSIERVDHRRNGCASAESESLDQQRARSGFGSAKCGCGAGATASANDHVKIASIQFAASQGRSSSRQASWPMPRATLPGGCRPNPRRELCNSKSYPASVHCLRKGAENSVWAQW